MIEMLACLALFFINFITAYKIIKSDKNDRYKTIWLIAIVLLPIVGIAMYYLLKDKELPFMTI